MDLKVRNLHTHAYQVAFPLVRDFVRQYVKFSLYSTDLYQVSTSLLVIFLFVRLSLQAPKSVSK